MAVQVTIDDRERGVELAGSLARQLGRPPAVARLELGDIAIGDAYLIERKTAADFVASLLDRRLASQLDRLAKLKEPRPIVIVEGPFNAMALAGMDPVEVRQAMLDVLLDWRIPLVRSHDFDHTVQWIVELVRRAERAASATMPYQPASRPPARKTQVSRSLRPEATSSPEALQLAALQKIPGLGKNKASLLLERFGSISGIRNSSVEQIADVPGIGRETAEQIVKALK